MQWSETQIREQVEACLGADTSLFLVDVVLNSRRGGYQLIVKCEADDGITIDQLTRINRSIDEQFTLPGLDTDSLTVEVTSPGPGIAVKLVRHFRRHIGYDMKIKHRSKTVASPLKGKLQAVSETVLQVQVGDDQVDIPLDLIDEARTQFQW